MYEFNTDNAKCPRTYLSDTVMITASSSSGFAVCSAEIVVVLLSKIKLIKPAD